MNVYIIIDDLPWDGWSIGRKGAAKILELLDAQKPKLLLDVGSGLSTILMAAWAADNDAVVVSLEHERKYADQTQKYLNKYNLTADLRINQLKETEHGFFYDTELPDGIDFALIDGPPGTIGREGTFYSIYPHLNPNFLVILDDAQRKHESEMLEQWKRDFNIIMENKSRMAEIRPTEYRWSQ